METSDYRELFLAEAQEYLQTLNGCLLELERSPKNSENLTEMFRVMHSMKGMAGTMGYDQITEVSHALENFLEELKSGSHSPGSDTVDLLFEGVDLLQKLLENPDEPSQSQKDAASRMLEKIKGVTGLTGEDEQDTALPQHSSGESNTQEEVSDREEGSNRREESADASSHLENYSWELTLDASQQEILRGALEEGGKGYAVEVFLREDVLMKSVRAYMALRALESYGHVVTTVPSMNDLEQENFERSFVVFLVAASSSEEKMKKSVWNITEIDDVHLYAWDAHSKVDVSNLPVKAATTEESTEEDPRLKLNEMEKEILKAGIKRGGQAYAIKVTLKEGTMMKSVRAYMVLRALEQHGEVVTTTPSMQDLDEEKFGLSFLVGLVAVSFSEDSAKKALLNIAEVESVEINPWEAEEGQDASEEVQDRETVSVEEKNKEGKSLEDKKSSEATENEAPAMKVMEKTVRVETAKLDELINLVGEMVINRTQVLELGKGYAEDLDRSLEQLDRITSDLQGAAMKLRMVPIKLVFERFPRMVRDISRESGKKVQLFISGEDTELDRSLINQLSDPLVHLLRNSIDHGIEGEEERWQKGKEVRGNVYLGAHHEGSHVVITVADDGRGLDPQKIKDVAVKKGVVTAEEASKLKEEEIYNLIFYNGFSTSEEVSEVSGRGVGMDAVKNNVEAMHGTVEVKSEPGEGSKFILRLPLTLAIIKALMVEAGEQMYAIPIENIRENFFLEPQQIKTIQKGWVANLREEVIPIYFLSEMLGFPAPRKEVEEYPVVVVATGEHLAGLIVDRMVGQQEVVIKTLGNFLKELKGVAGATVLGDGRVSLIIDVVGLLDYGRVEIVQNSINS